MQEGKKETFGSAPIYLESIRIWPSNIPIPSPIFSFKLIMIPVLLHCCNIPTKSLFIWTAAPLAQLSLLRLRHLFHRITYCSKQRGPLSLVLSHNYWLHEKESRIIGEGLGKGKNTENKCCVVSSAGHLKSASINHYSRLLEQSKQLWCCPMVRVIWVCSIFNYLALRRINSKFSLKLFYI